MKKIYIVLLLLAFNTVFGQEQVKKNKFGIKLNVNSVLSSDISRDPFFFASQIQLNRYDSVNASRSFRIIPSFFIENKKQNLWEFHVLFANFTKSDNYFKTSQFDSLLLVTSQSYQNGQMLNSIDLKFGVKNHINLAKKNSRFRAFLTFNYLMGFRRFEVSPYTSSSFYRKFTLFNLDLGLSTRLGYNITEKLFIEINPPIILSSVNTIGRGFEDNPILPEFQRKRPILQINPAVIYGFTLKEIGNFFIEDSKYSNILSIGYTF